MEVGADWRSVRNNKGWGAVIAGPANAANAHNILEKDYVLLKVICIGGIGGIGGLGASPLGEPVVRNLLCRG